MRYKRDLEPEVAAAIRSASDTVPYDIVAPILRSHISYVCLCFVLLCVCVCLLSVWL